jgi:hypothetical protein
MAHPNLFNLIMQSFNQERSYEYDENMPGDELIEIGLNYRDIHDYDTMIQCFKLAINKDYIPAMLSLATYYAQNNIQLDEMVKLFTTVYEKGEREGLISLIEYYKSKDNLENMVKYSDILLEKFNTTKHIYYLINEYKNLKKEEICLKYCNQLLSLKPLDGYFTLGHIYHSFYKFNESIASYKKCLELFNPETTTIANEQFYIIIKYFIENETELKYIQAILHKFKIVDNSIQSNLQYRINKTNQYEYKKEEECAICMDSTNIKLYDCLGHWYCDRCTSHMVKCASCGCSKKCFH